MKHLVKPMLNNNSFSMMTSEVEIPLYDALSVLSCRTISCLDHGSVRLHDCMPRLIPVGRTLDLVAPVESARTSFGSGLKDLKADTALVEYLVRNAHTSPLESVLFTFYWKLPLFVARQLMRHRTASFNEFSMRYAENTEDIFYDPTKMTLEEVPGGGIRMQSKTNKQASDNADMTSEKMIRLREAFAASQELVRQQFEIYHQMIAMGCSKETARIYLPVSIYTQVYCTINLNNLLKMLYLRLDSHAQPETIVYAQAMADLIRPLVPVVMKTFFEMKMGIQLTPPEIQAIQEKRNKVSNSVSANRDYQSKLTALGLSFETTE